MLYGAEASNLALKSFATGGVVIGGGVARRIPPKLVGRLVPCSTLCVRDVFRGLSGACRFMLLIRWRVCAAPPTSSVSRRRKGASWGRDDRRLFAGAFIDEGVAAR